MASADLVITLLENGAIVEEVLFQQGTSQGLRAGALVVDMSSIQPRQARDHAARLAAIGVMHMDAPVSGGTVGAEAGTLAHHGGRKGFRFRTCTGCLPGAGDVPSTWARTAQASWPNWPTR